jgi:hypothetical protein
VRQRAFHQDAGRDGDGQACGGVKVGRDDQGGLANRFGDDVGDEDTQHGCLHVM